NLDDVIGIVALVALADLVAVVGDTTNVIGAGREIAGKRNRDLLVVVVAGLADRRQRARRRQRRKHRIGRGDGGIGGDVDPVGRQTGHAVAEVHVVSVDRDVAAGRYGCAAHRYVFGQIGLLRRRDRDLDHVIGIVALVALAELVGIVGDAADVVGAGREIAGKRNRDLLMVVVAGLADRRQRARRRQRRKHRIGRGDGGIGRNIDPVGRQTGHADA